MPSNRKKKLRREKQKKRGGEKVKRKRQELSVQARTSQANVLHLDQEAAKCTTCERIHDTFYLLQARQLITRKQLNCQNTFFGKISGSVWVNEGLMAIKKLFSKQIFFNNIIDYSLE